MPGPGFGGRRAAQRNFGGATPPASPSPYAALLAEAAATGVVADFTGNSFAWGGATRLLTDLTANADGSYDLNYGAWFSGEATVLIDYNNTGTPADGDNYFSWAAGTTDRVEWEALMLSGDVSKGMRVYAAPGGVHHNCQQQFPGRTETVRATGNQRTLTTIKSGATPRLQQGNWPSAPGTSALGTFTTPTKLRFRGRARFTDKPLTNATLHRVLIWNRVLSEAELALLGQGPIAPVHLVGDSFLNTDSIRGPLQTALVPRGYIPVTQDGIGSTSLTQQAVRLAANSVVAGSPSVTYDIAKWKGSTLVIMDGGLSDTSAEAIDAITTMAGLLTHDRWLYVEPAPADATGTSARTDWNARVAAIRAFVGEDRFIPSLAPALAAGNGSTADNAEVAQGLWPLSLKTSVSDFHPNVAGSTFLAGLIAARLSARGWA